MERRRIDTKLRKKETMERKKERIGIIQCQYHINQSKKKSCTAVNKDENGMLRDHRTVGPSGRVRLLSQPAFPSHLHNSSTYMYWLLCYSGPVSLSLSICQVEIISKWRIHPKELWSRVWPARHHRSSRNPPEWNNQSNMKWNHQVSASQIFGLLEDVTGLWQAGRLSCDRRRFPLGAWRRFFFSSFSSFSFLTWIKSAWWNVTIESIKASKRSPEFFQQSSFFGIMKKKPPTPKKKMDAFLSGCVSSVSNGFVSVWRSSVECQFNGGVGLIK